MTTNIETLTVHAVPGERALASQFNTVVDKVNEIIGSLDDAVSFDDLHIASTITPTGKIYRITDDITLSDETTYTLADGSILIFEGGKLIGGNGTQLYGTNTSISATPYQIFDNVELAGTWNNVVCYAEWWGAKGDDTTDDTAALTAAINSPFNKLQLLQKTYAITSGLYLPEHKAIEGVSVSERSSQPSISVSATVSESDPVVYIIRVRSFCELRNFNLYGRGRAYYGIYGIGDGSSGSDPHKLNLEGLSLFHFKVGISLHTFLTRISSCHVTGAKVGFKLLGGTSTTMINCYVKGFMMMAYFIKSMTYSSMINCCADTCHAWSDGTRHGSTNPTQTESPDNSTNEEKQEFLGDYYGVFYGFTYLFNQCRAMTIMSCACEDVVKGMCLENSHVIRIISTTMDMQGVTRTSDSGRVLRSQISSSVTIEGFYVTDWAGNQWETAKDVIALYSGSKTYGIVIRNFTMRSYNSSHVDTTWQLSDKHIKESGEGLNVVKVEYDNWKIRGSETEKPTNVGWIVGRGFQYYNLSTKMMEVWNGNRWVQLVGNDASWCYNITQNTISKEIGDLEVSTSVASGDDVPEWVLTKGILYNAAAEDDWINLGNRVGEQCTFKNYLPHDGTKMYCLWFRVYEGDVIWVRTSRVGNVPQSTPTLLIADAEGIITYRKLNTDNIITGYDDQGNPIYDMESEITDTISAYQVQHDGFAFTSVDEDYFNSFGVQVNRVVKTNVIEERLNNLESGQGANIDSELSDTSTRAVQNKVVTSALQTKFASAAFVNGVLYLYADPEKTVLIAEVPLGSTTYTVSQNCNHDSGFYVLSGETEHNITVTPTTLASAFGSQNVFVENYLITVSIQNGSGSFVTVADEVALQSGRTYSLNIRDLLVIGTNTVRIKVEGQSSNVSVESDYTCTLTNLTFSCDFSWWNAWVWGETFGIDGIKFSGNIEKYLHVRIDGEESMHYTQRFSQSTNYNTTSYFFTLSDKLPGLVTGISTIEIWLEGGGATTEVITYNVMCVAASDASTAKLVVINNAKDKAVNYASETSLFQYATYNTTSVNIDVRAYDGSDTFVIHNNEEFSGIVTETANDFPISLSMASFVQTSDFELTATLTTPDNHSAQHVFPVDNSESYSATTGATVYFNLASRNNSQSNRTTFINEADAPAAASYAGTFTGFAWNKDGYAVDSDNNMGLRVMAGSTVEIPTLKPLTNTQTSSASIEFMYRASDIADYSKPIMSIMSTSEYDENTTNGIILFPTQIKVLTSAERRHVFQSYNVSENDILHVVIVFQRNYAGTGNNICRIYVNACPVVNFEYSGISSFGNGYLRMGQDSADFQLYMFRAYNIALEPNDVVFNFLNALIENNEYSRRGLRNDNAIMDGGSISYELAKQKGFNCYVVETDEELPSFHNNTSISSLNVRLEYADHPEWNVRIVGVPMDGQGTTSKQYYRWNLRNNNKNSNARWEYLNLTDGGSMRVETGKDGYIAGYNLHPKVSKITAKKNIASSSQGHKMGATNLYNDLWHKFFDSNLNSTHYLPDVNTRVAVYQYPFLGFKMSSNGYYEFIGLYTIGPDKTDKKTFGYNKTSDYPSLMMLEGPNHAPRMSRFLAPWTADMVYNPSTETMECGGQEGWDADIVADYSSDKASDQASIQALYEAEFKPAYDLIFLTSPYIRPLSATGKTISQINADINTFWQGRTSGYSNVLLTFYDSSYNLYYYRIKTQQYESLGINIRTYLGLSGSPTEAQIQAACESKFLSEINNYVSLEEAIFHKCYTILDGATDNDTKNTYWRKFLALASGGKWGFNQDDLDTIMASDNNGQSTKSYSIEPGDTTENGDEIYQGQSSAFWTRIDISCQDQIAQMMGEIVRYMDEIASEHGLTGSTLHERILKVFSYYFWDNASKYFPAIAYAEDTEYGYLAPWVENHTQTYNSVEPLTQALGTQYNAELIWVERRIAYIFSKYKIGGFGSATGEYGQLSFTPSDANTASFNVVPAIDLYPRESRGGSAPEQGARTSAGGTCVIAPSSDGATTFYLLGLNWYTDIGDLKNLVLTSRGGVTVVTFDVAAERLRRLKVGDADASSVTFNATSLSVRGNAIELVDARNVTSLIGTQGTVDLTNCPRLREAYFAGTKIVLLKLPIGGKVRNLSLPSTTTTLFLYSLPFLTTSNISIDSYSGVTSVYINNCAGINPVTLVRRCYNSSNSALKYVTIIWNGNASGQSSDITMLAYMARHLYNQDTGAGYGSVAYNSNDNSVTNVGDKPTIEGRLNISNGSATREDVNIINSTFPNLTITGITAYFITFADSEALRVMLQVCGDGTGITEAQAAALSTMGRPDAPAVSLFYQNTTVATFDEFTYFTGIHSIPSGLFQGCTKLTSVVMPRNISGVWSETFMGCIKLTSVTLPSSLAAPTENYNVFNGCTSLVSVTLPSSWTYLGHQMFAGCTKLDMTIPSTVTRLGYRAFAESGIKSGKLLSSDDATSIYQDCTKLTSVSFYSGIEEIKDSTFNGCTALALTSLPSTVTTIGANAFGGCTALALTALPTGLTSLGQGAFYACSSLAITTIPSGVADIPNNCFRGCSNTNITALHNGITYIGDWAFYDAGISISTWPTGYSSTEIGAYAFSSTNVSISSLPASVTTVKEHAFSSCLNITNFTFSNTVTEIKHHAFAYCTNFNTSALPSGLTEISEAAFDGTSLSISSLPSGITKIGAYAFQNTKLTISSIPSGVTEIGGGAFQGVTTMSVTALPSGLTKVGGSAFQNCHEGLACEIGTGITYIGSFAFIGTNITKVHLGSDMTECHNPFQGCSRLTEIDMEESAVTELEERFAYQCALLDKIDLPKNITYIGVQAFARSSTYTTVIIRVTNPSTLTMDTEAFPSGQTIHVPVGTSSAYTARFPGYTFVEGVPAKTNPGVI